MNEWNSLEPRFANWKPRPPSRELKARLFGASAAAPEHPDATLGELWRWMIPALGCFLLVISSLSARLDQPHIGRLASTNLPLAMNGAPPDPAYFPHPRANCQQNAVPIRTLVWTFGPRSAVTASNQPLLTNSLIQ